MYQYVREHQEKKREAGICRECTKPATHGVFCQEHREKYNAITREVRAERKKNGVCILCGDKLSKESSNYCNKHTRYFRKKQELSDIAIFGALAKILEKKRADKKKIVEIKAKLKEIINNSGFKLNDQEKIVLDFRVLSSYPETHDQLARRLNVTRQRAQQIESSLTKKLYSFLLNNNYLIILREML